MLKNRKSRIQGNRKDIMGKAVTGTNKEDVKEHITSSSFKYVKQR
jgi:hypothetical protein